MILTERDDGEYRIYAGAMEATQGDGYIAAVVVTAGHASREAFRDDSLACGHRWVSSKAALSFAMDKGLEVVRRERHRGA